MNTPSADDIKRLMKAQGSPCISIFLPTNHRAGAKIWQDQQRLRNMLRATRHTLLAYGFPMAQIKVLCKPIKTLLERSPVWSHPGDGMAIFCSPELFACYQLPYSVREQERVGVRFHLKPLLPMLVNEKPFYILALSQNEVRLLKATRYGLEELALPPSVPTSLAEVMRDSEADNEVEYHSSASGATVGKGGRRPVVFHGQGVGTDDEKSHLLRYFQKIDHGLHELLHGETAPLVLASAEFLWPIYREANTYPYLSPGGVAGNPDRKQVSSETLHRRAWPLVEPSVLKGQQETLAQFDKERGTDRVSENVSEVVPAAFEGRVRDLLVAIDQDQWGTYDPVTYTVSIHESAEMADEDLLDLAARQTLLHGGAVYALAQDTMPRHALLAAVYRY